MNVGVVGGGPGGSFLSWKLASAGIPVTVFDPTHPREKPCAGGMTGAGFSKFDFLHSATLSYKNVHAVTCISPQGVQAELRLDEPIRTFSRMQLDRYVLDSATRNGAQWIRSRVTDVERNDNGWLIHTGREKHSFDFLVGADGAHSLVRRKLAGKAPAESLMIALGYLARKTMCDHIIVKFVGGLRGYMWVFPRTGATSLGICGPAACTRAQELRSLLHAFLQEKFPAFRPQPDEAYRSTIFCRGKDRSVPFCAQTWALVGDAAGFVDPITLEGIRFAFESAELLATAIEEGEPERYAQLCRNAFLRKRMKATELAKYIYRSDVLDMLVRMAGCSSTARAMLMEVYSGTIGYDSLRAKVVGMVGRRAAAKLLSAHG